MDVITDHGDLTRATLVANALVARLRRDPRAREVYLRCAVVVVVEADPAATIRGRFTALVGALGPPPG